MRIRELEEIQNSDFPDVKYHTVDGWDEAYPEFTRENMLFLASKYNELVRTLKDRLCE